MDFLTYLLLLKFLIGCMIFFFVEIILPGFWQQRYQGIIRFYSQVWRHIFCSSRKTYQTKRFTLRAFRFLLLFNPRKK